MKTEIDNPPAFPRTESEHIQPQSGMDLRDYFAAKATEDDIEHHMNAIGKNAEAWPTRERCKFAYADAMLKARTA
jgi:hypothetical protein